MSAVVEYESIAVRVSKVVACNPKKSLSFSLLITSVISFIGLYVGDFKIEVEVGVWESRGTLIATREMQNQLVNLLQDTLFENPDKSVWEDVESNVIEIYDDDEEDAKRDRRLSETCQSATYYYSNMLSENNLYGLFKTEPSTDIPSKSILDPDVLFQICEAETETNNVLQQSGLCGKCADDQKKCVPPFSLLLALRLSLGAMDSSCIELKALYTKDVQDIFTTNLVQCSNGFTISQSDEATSDKQCPWEFFQPTLVDTKFGKNGNMILRHTSSYFITYEVDQQDLYDIRSEYGQTDEALVAVAYDTLYETQNKLYVDMALFSDMSLAIASLTITIIAITSHTKSLWLTIIGVLQILFSVPLAYFVYYFIVGLRFFPVLNFIGFFVATALGADDIFVSVDKWKNERLSKQSATTEEIAAIVLPDAASAMLLTTCTTAVAFFATTICPVAPIYSFALYCGLLVMFNYILNILFIFPALCIYDTWLGKNGMRNLFIHCNRCSKSVFDERKIDSETCENEEKSTSLIHKVLSFYYRILHTFRIYAIFIFLALTGTCIYIALTIELPDDANVRLLPKHNTFELHHVWKKELLSFSIYDSSGNNGVITWGLVPRDTGPKRNPDSLSTLELDHSFNPSKIDAQKYLLGFCNELYATDLASQSSPDELCPINEFDSWLRIQSNSSTKDQEYVEYCNNAKSLPIDEELFDSCIIAWSKLTDNRNILNKEGKVKILRSRIKAKLGWDAPYAEMDKYWKEFEKFMEIERSNAPITVNKMFHTASGFHWYDTNTSMLNTAIGSALIAITFSAVVVLIASRSLELSIFSVLCITFILSATTASLVGLGWSLGFMESVCFSILIGISCDFVIHFSHAYIHNEGNIHRYERTEKALIHMGPSILAAAFTTIAAASVMLFCEITFNRKFAIILFMTIMYATLGSFIVFLVLTDSFGPSEPTKFIDSLWIKMKSICTYKSVDGSLEPTTIAKGWGV